MLLKTLQNPPSRPEFGITMNGIIQASKRSLLSLSRTLLPNIHEQFPLQINKFTSRFLPIYATTTFSTSTLQHKSPFESNLLRMLTNEIEFESEYAPQPLDKKFNAFMVEDRPGEQFVTLRGRSTIDENIKIEATMFDGYGTVSPILRDEDTELNPQLHISLLVHISKGEGGDMLEFVCSAWPERLEIEKLYILALDGKLSRPYIGPDFRGLDKKLQRSVYEFLNARGVNNDLSVFLHHYVWNKDKLEHIQRLKLLKSYIER